MRYSSNIIYISIINIIINIIIYINIIINIFIIINIIIITADLYTIVFICIFTPTLVVLLLSRLPTVFNVHCLHHSQFSSVGCFNNLTFTFDQLLPCYFSYIRFNIIFIKYIYFPDISISKHSIHYIVVKIAV